MGCDFENPIVGVEALLWIHVTLVMYTLGVWSFWKQAWWQHVHTTIDHLIIRSSYVVTALVLLSIGSGLAHANVWCVANWPTYTSVHLWYLFMVGTTSLFYLSLMTVPRPEIPALAAAAGVVTSVCYGVYSFTSNEWATVVAVITGLINLINFFLAVILMWHVYMYPKNNVYLQHFRSQKRRT